MTHGRGVNDPMRNVEASLLRHHGQCRCKLARNSAPVSRCVSRSASEQETAVPPKCSNAIRVALNAFDAGRIRRYGNGVVANVAQSPGNPMNFAQKKHKYEIYQLLSFVAEGEELGSNGLHLHGPKTSILPAKGRVSSRAWRFCTASVLRQREIDRPFSALQGLAVADVEML
jgi:hypothetical protein